MLYTSRFTNVAGVPEYYLNKAGLIISACVELSIKIDLTIIKMDSPKPVINYRY